MAAPARPAMRFLHPNLLSGRTWTTPATLTHLTRLPTRQASTKRPVPAPTPFVSTPERFLSLIGRKMSQHASKFEDSWEKMFTLSGPEMKELGLEPARDRRYLLAWLERYRQGRLGIGADFKHVDAEGAGLVRVAELEHDPGLSPEDAVLRRRRRIVINVPPDEPVKDYLAPPTQPLPVSAAETEKVQHIKFRLPRNMAGTGIQLVKGSAGTMGLLKPVEGLWEIKRGRKIDGGERRQKQVRALRRVAERKKRA